MAVFVGSNPIEVPDISDIYVGNQRVYSSKRDVSYSGSFRQYYSYVTVNGVQHLSAGSEKVKAGSTISVYVGATTSTYLNYCNVKVNGTTVKTGYGSYDHVVNKDCTVVMTYHAIGMNGYYTAEITEV